MNRKKIKKFRTKAKHDKRHITRIPNKLNVNILRQEMVEPEFQVVGVQGGVIEPTEINVKVFTDAIKSVEQKGMVPVHKPKLSFTEKEYNEAWSMANDKVGHINLTK